MLCTLQKIAMTPFFWVGRVRHHLTLAQAEVEEGGVGGGEAVAEDDEEEVWAGAVARLLPWADKKMRSEWKLFKEREESPRK